MRERGTGGGFEFGSDSQARTPWLHSAYMLVYLLALALVGWPVAVGLLRRLEGPPSWWWAVVFGCGPFLVRLLVYRISAWWSVPGPVAVAVAHLAWPLSWWVAVVGAVATAVAGFGAFGIRFVLEQRDWPYEVLDTRRPHPPAPEPAVRLVPVHHGPRSGSDQQQAAETRAALAAASRRLQLPTPGAEQQALREEEANWRDLEAFVKALDRGESADIRSWVTDPPRIMPSGRPMTQGMWRRFTKAVEAVGGAVRRTARRRSNCACARRR